MSFELTGYVLSALTGYLLFAAISGRFNPFSRPSVLHQRPAWALGIWTGCAVASVSAGFLFVIDHTDLSGSLAAASSAAWILGALLVPGLIAAMAYRNTINATLIEEMRLARARALALTAESDIPLPEEHAPGMNLTDKHLEELGFFDAPDAPRAGQPSASTETSEAFDPAETDHDAESLSIEPLDADTFATTAGESATSLAIEPLDMALSPALTPIGPTRVDPANTSLVNASLINDGLINDGPGDDGPVSDDFDKRPCREDLEDRLKNLEMVNARRDEEISALLAQLKREKRRTRDDVASLARQWLLQERQLFARRSTLGKMARRAEGQLTPRLARRVARARSIVPSI